MDIIERCSISGGPFSSTSVVETVNGFPKGDKALDAEFLATMMSCIVTNGVASDVGEELEVYPTNSLEVSVGPGCAWANGHMAKSDTFVHLQIEPDEDNLIILRFDFANGSATLMSVVDDTGMVPRRTSTLYDLVLAEVYVDSDEESVTSDCITDTRSNAYNCGFAASKL